MPQQQLVPDTLRSAPLVKSLVALHRGKCVIEHDNEGCHLRVSIMASAAGEAAAYFRATGFSAGELGQLAAAQVSQQRFDAGPSQDLRLYLCAGDMRKALEGFAEEESQHSLVLDLRVDSSDATVVTAQRSVLKLDQEGDSLHVIKQLVQCGPVVRSLEALYGTLPNPRSLTAGASTDGEGGDCVICLSKPRDVAILHCRHVCLCTACAKITSSTWSFQCPVCRGRVAAMVGMDEAAGQG